MLVVLLTLLTLLLLRTIAFYPLLVLTRVKALLEGLLWVIECRCGADHGDIRDLASFVNVCLGC
jgi:hypothetical protein